MFDLADYVKRADQNSAENSCALDRTVSTGMNTAASTRVHYVSIGQKITKLIITTTLIALTLNFVITNLSRVADTKSNTIKEFQSLAHVTAVDSQAALLFNDSKSAKESVLQNR